MRRALAAAFAFSSLAFAQHYADEDQLVPPSALPALPIPAKPFELPGHVAGEPPVVSRFRVEAPAGAFAPAAAHLRAGALSGKTVYVSQGHGFYYDASPLGRWATQRPN